MEKLNSEDLKELVVAVEGLGIRAHIIAETGSKGWGTDVAGSDHDLTVIADDVDYDIFTYPRAAFTKKILFKGEEIDCRVFSIERFMRKILKSNLSAYEVIHAHWHVGADYLRNLLSETMDYFYDPREMFRSSRGNIAEIRDKGWKGRRQMFRYSFICLQLIDGLRTKAKPVMNVHDYLNLPDTGFFTNKAITKQLFEACMTEVLSDIQLQEMEVTMRGIREYHFPAVVKLDKQNEGRDFMNEQFAKFKALTFAANGDNHATES